MWCVDVEYPLDDIGYTHTHSRTVREGRGGREGRRGQGGGGAGSGRRSSEVVLVWLQLGCALHCMLRPKLHFTAAPALTTNRPQTPHKNRY